MSCITFGALSAFFCKQINVIPPDSCVYKNVQYNQGETWEDGCQYKCRCDDADKGLYVCSERYSSLLKSTVYSLLSQINIADSQISSFEP